MIVQRWLIRCDSSAHTRKLTRAAKAEIDTLIRSMDDKKTFRALNVSESIQA